MLRWEAIVNCSLMAVLCMAAWRITGWPVFPGAGGLALLVAVVLLRDV